MTSTAASGHEYVRGVPHALPDGEHVLWQGAPSARAVARHVFHQRLIIVYFALMLALWAGSAVRAPDASFAVAFGIRFALALAVVAIVEVLSQGVARTSWYAITNRRIVLRIGVVIPMSINIPFALMAAADVIEFRDRTGQIAIRMEPGNRIAYVALWPHCRVFRFNNPTPLLRGLVAPRVVGEALAEAVAAASNGDNLQPVADLDIDTATHQGGVLTAAGATA